MQCSDKAQVAKLIATLSSATVDLSAIEKFSGNGDAEQESALNDSMDEDGSDTEPNSMVVERSVPAEEERGNGDFFDLRKQNAQMKGAHPILREIQVSTVDAFQGAEKGGFLKP